ncbi:hypothetical protein SDRG_06487 [Saprolegnia diclina VS20]|uniref:Uncharacterized protein n=1 Tax=Saprolegnia diclina (strain VS20) TaxID=1156394 RepID=T0QEP2_SAPDV|nr:hypothetical protein SDRG_06487 [Saprolegnia diclina VS20]EQC36384.1 hypothetical protein SDRG_06487 [Saprolegnia diclina VS20]|eukprot:XP_008610490.1 hypothetical protein SDRG_06487 [Saprolegnia diclina VS20]
MAAATKDVDRKMTDHDYLLMERELYEESIRALEVRLAQLEDGTLPEYVEQVQAFAAEKQSRLDLARLRRDLLEKNSAELLAFDLQQLDEVYAQAMERALRTPPPSHDELDTCAIDNTALPLPIGKTLSNSELEAALDRTLDEKRRLFNLEHIAAVQPSTSTIVAQLQTTRDAWQAAQVAMDASSPEECFWDAMHKTLHICEQPYRVGDAIVLHSALANEDFYGEIASANETAVQLKLLCDSVVTVPLASLRDRRCRLQRQDDGRSSDAPFSPAPTTPLRRASTPRSRRKSRSRRVLSLL